MSFFIFIKVLEVVRSNYDSLTLKMQDSLDQFERYAEKPKETTFFSQLVSRSTLWSTLTESNCWSSASKVEDIIVNVWFVNKFSPVIIANIECFVMLS